MSGTAGKGRKNFHLEGILLGGGASAHAPRPSRRDGGGGGAGVGQTAGFARGQELARARYSKLGVWEAEEGARAAGGALRRRRGLECGAGHAAGPFFSPLSFNSLSSRASALLLGPRGRGGGIA